MGSNTETNVITRMLEGFVAILQQSESPTVDVVNYLGQTFAPLRSDSTCIFLACAPKSASTYLSKLLSDITGFEQKNFIQHNLPGFGDQDVSIPKVIDGLCQNGVVQQHITGHPANTQVLRDYNIRPVIMTRNIFDVVPSVRDQWVNSIEFLRAANAHVYDRFVALSPEAQHDYVIDFSIPWFIQFYASWQYVVQHNELDTLWVTYHDVTRQTLETVQKIVAFYNLDVPEAQIQRAIELNQQEKAGTNFNQGVEGRGEKILTDAQRQRIVAMVQYFHDIDFSPIGIEAV